MERSTRTIVQQVESMQQMVNAFSEYARAPEMNTDPLQPEPAGQRSGGPLLARTTRTRK